MKSQSNCSLSNYNSFAVDAVSPKVLFIQQIEDLNNLPDLSLEPFYILGEGSNTLFVEARAPLIIKAELKGKQFIETEQYYELEVAAGENWHQLVTWCVENRLYGLENLALIPGSVGAAPIQNIGAYGVEFSDYCTHVHWYEFNTKKIQRLPAKVCAFAYRDSIFKHELKNRGMITSVTLRFPKHWRANLTYADLRHLPVDIDAPTLMQYVVKLRQDKLPDPQQLPNAGSFFKNPLISTEQYHQLKLTFGEMPHYDVGADQVKLAAGWLIDHAGLKGYKHQGVGIHENQALVLVNYEKRPGIEVLALAQYVQHQVWEKYQINLQPEVRLIASYGEQELNRRCQNG